MRFQGDGRAEDLYAAVLAAMDDDAPRLVLADHLISKGDPRGDLIVMQCKRGELGLALETADETTIIAGLPESTVTARCQEWAMQRGFLDEVVFDNTATHGVAFEDVQRLVASPEAETITSLTLRAVDGGHALARLIGDAMRGSLARLRKLKISRCYITSAGVDALLASCPAPLEELVLDNNGISDGGARTIAEHAPTTLERLNLSHNEIGPNGAQALTRSPRLANLHSLWLVRCLSWISVKGFFTGHLPSLRKLDISWSELGEWASFLTHVKLGHLEDLDLCGNAIGDDGLMALVRGHDMGNLRALRIGNNRLTDTGIEFLCRYARELPNLRTLLVENNGITDRSLDLLLKSFELESLGIWGEHALSPEGLARYREAFPSKDRRARRQSR